jgi:cytochrome c
MSGGITRRGVLAGGPLVAFHPWREAFAQSPVRHDGAITTLALSPEGDKAVSGGADGAVIRWNLETGAGTTYRFHVGAVTAIAYLPDDWVVSLGQDRRIALWKPGEAVPLATLSGSPDVGTAVGISEAIGGIAVGYADGTLRVWIGSGIINDAALTVGRPAVTVVGVAFSSDQTNLISGHRDGTIRITPITGGEARVSAIRSGARALAVAFDGEMVVAGDNGAVHLLDRSGTLRTSVLLVDGALTRMALSFNGDIVATATADGRLVLFERLLATRLALARIPAGDTALAFHPDGKRLFTGHPDGSIRVWSATDGAPLGALSPGPVR